MRISQAKDATKFGCVLCSVTIAALSSSCEKVVQMIAKVRDTARALELSNELRRFAPGNADVIETIAVVTAASGN
ncbi:MAG: hypothetical protein ACI9R3_003071 [Verrucomicrobiales bacterium]|jgi:hypothetical protein